MSDDWYTPPTATDDNWYTPPSKSATEVKPTAPKPPSKIENIGRGLEGAFKSAVSNNLMVQPIRWGMEAVDYGGYKQKLREKFPGRSDEWYEKATDKLYDTAIKTARTTAQEQVEQNPYPGHQVGNFVAGVVGSADPTWLIAPGASLAAKPTAGQVAKFVGKQAAIQGGLAGVTDLATQGLDISEGMQEGIDAGRLATAGATGAAFGAGFGGVQVGIRSPQFQEFIANSNAPDFVKGLFLQRGKDLTPEANPFESQVGQQSAAMSPENISRHREVLAKGSLDDINSFYEEVGGPRPSPESIDQWMVEREKLGVPAAPKPEVLERQIHKDTIKAHVTDQTKTWKNSPNVNIVDTLDEVSPEAKAAFDRDGVTPENTVGVLGPDGQVYIFANQIKTPEAANAVLFHEALGHYGLAQQFGSKLDSTLQTLVSRNVGQFGKKVTEWMEKNPEAYGGNKLRAAEEVLAEMSQNGPLPKSIGDAVVSSLRRFARSMGVDLKFSDAEVKHILSLAHSAVINGKGRDVVANRFQGLYRATDFGAEPESRQMYVGDNARGSAMFGEFFEGPDGKPRMEISDHTAQWDETHSSRKGTADLDEVLVHPELFKAYPELRGVKVVRDVSGVGGNRSDIQGYFDSQKNQLHISPDAVDPASTALHEIQHWIQFKEGWAKGGNSDMFEPHNSEAIEKLVKKYRRDLKSVTTNQAEVYINRKIEKAEALLEGSGALKKIHETMIDSERKAKSALIQINRISARLDELVTKDEFWNLPEYKRLSDLRHDLQNQHSDLTKKLDQTDAILHQLKQKNKDLAFDYYTHLTGEVEARDVQARRAMTPEQRADTAPYTLTGVEPDEMISINVGGRPQSRQMTPEQLEAQLESGDVDIQRLERAYENAYEGYVPIKRSDKEVERAAIAAGVAPSRVKRLKGVGDLAERIYRSQKAADVLTARIQGLLDKEGTPDWTVRDADNLRQALIDHSYILSKLWDDTSEVGRALRVAKMGYTRSSMEAYKELLAEHGGTFSGLADDETLNRFARSLKALMAGGNNPNGVNALVKGLNKPNWEEYLLSARVNMMLSGMSTHVTAVTDMIDGIGLDLMDNAAGLIPGLGREGLRALGIPVQQGIHPAEVAARMWGVVRAGMEASTYVDALHTLQHGSNRQTTGGRQYARIPVLSKVGDLIAAEDQFFRAFATNMHLYGLGVRQAVEAARASGKKPSFDDLMSAGISHARYPSNELLREAEKAAETNLLLSDNILTNPIDALRRSAQSGPLATHEHKFKAVAQRVASFAVSFLLPFVRTATNSLYQRVMRRSPLTMLDPATLRDLSIGGAKADVAMGRIMLALASTAIAWNAAGLGKTTGEGPENPYKKAIKMGTGWRPRSTYTEGEGGEPGFYNNSQNLGNRLGITDMNSQFATSIAALREAYEKGANEGQVAVGTKLAIYSALKSIGQNFWLNDIADTWSTFTDPMKAWKREEEIGQQLSSFVIPNAVAQAARIQDRTNPMVRVKGDLGQTVENVFKSKIPGMRETLPDQMTPFGTPVQGGQALAGQTTALPQGNRITGGNYVEETQDPAILEIARLDEFSKKAIITLPKRKIKVNGEEIELTNAQLSEYQREAGQQSVEAVREMMETEEWAAMSDEEKAAWISKEQNKVKKRVREELFGGGEDD